MPDVVEFRREGGIAVITVNHPPVNALNNAMRKGLVEALGRARDDADVKGVVIAAAGRTFIAGADITEFNQPPVSPTTIDVIETLDAMPKPVVAALHGTALGGGLEVALGCHFRVAAPETKLGLPEIKLGLMPGAGGTQRLPRLIGMEKALEMILSGNPITADQALSSGLVDQIVADDLISSAVAFANRVVAEKRPLTRARDRDDKLAELRAHPGKFDELAAPYAKRARGLHAPAKALEALRWTLDVPVAEALIRERDAFLELKNGAQSKAQRHIFFAEREAAKVADLPKDVKSVGINRAAVIGAGTMGGGIAMCFANAGIPVTIVETSADALKRGLDLVAKNYQASAKRGGMSAEDVEIRTGLIHGTTDIAEIADADMVIEAVFEDINVKHAVFAELDRICKPQAVLASNTSMLDINEIAARTSDPSRVLGTHFFSPANLMRLLEVVRGAKTSVETLATAVDFARRIGKIPVIAGVCHGFIGNRMLEAYLDRAMLMVEEGVSPYDIDKALENWGMAMGPFRMLDLAGNDVSYLVRTERRNRFPETYISPLGEIMKLAGRLGQKTGSGWYDYGPDAPKGKPSPVTEQLVADARKAIGRAPVSYTPDEIVSALVGALAGEGKAILGEGHAASAADIDVVYLNGYGFPRHRGGPMFAAETGQTAA